MSMKNFRAQDMPGGGGAAAAVKERPKPTQLPAEPTQTDGLPEPEPEPEVDEPVEVEEEVPAGTTAEILQWVGDDQERAQRALDVEQSHSSPRHGLTGELNKILGN